MVGVGEARRDKKVCYVDQINLMNKRTEILGMLIQTIFFIATKNILADGEMKKEKTTTNT